MKLLLDMNLTPMWVGFLQENGFEAVHWSAVGDLTASEVVSHFESGGPAAR